MLVFSSIEVGQLLEGSIYIDRPDPRAIPGLPTVSAFLHKPSKSNSILVIRFFGNDCGILIDETTSNHIGT